MRKSVLSTDMIEDLLIREKEFEYNKRQEAQAIIKCMAKDLEIHEKNATIITKCQDFINDRIDSIKLMKIKIKNLIEMNNIQDELKTYKLLNTLTTKRKAYNVHYYLERDYIDKHYIGNCGGMKIKEIEFKVFLKIEHIESGMISGKHYLKTFKKLLNARNYYDELIEKNKNKDINTLINQIINEIDMYCLDAKKSITKMNLRLKNNI